MSELFDKDSLTYRSREKIRSAKYKSGMENGFIIRFHKMGCEFLSGAIICETMEQALKEMENPTREKMCLGSDSQHLSVIYQEPVPIMISHKYTDEEYQELLDADMIPFSPFYDDTESLYDFAEITEENCWIIQNLIDGRYFTANEEFMKEYELLEEGV